MIFPISQSDLLTLQFKTLQCFLQASMIKTPLLKLAYKAPHDRAPYSPLPPAPSPTYLSLSLPLSSLATTFSGQTQVQLLWQTIPLFSEPSCPLFPVTWILFPYFSLFRWDIFVSYQLPVRSHLFQETFPDPCFKLDSMVLQMFSQVCVSTLKPLPYWVVKVNLVCRCYPL